MHDLIESGPPRRWALTGSSARKLRRGGVDLLAGEDVAIARAAEVLDQLPDGRGHIFNVGHGLLPETDPAVVRAVVDFVHERSSR